MLVSPELIRQYVRADDIDGADDALLLSCQEAAEAYVTDATERGAAELLEMGDGELPAPLRQAVLMLVAHWYNQREAVAGVQMQSVPYTIDALVKPFARLS